eukprot:749388-Hanusia_phi.AAC.2
MTCLFEDRIAHQVLENAFLHFLARFAHGSVSIHDDSDGNVQDHNHHDEDEGVEEDRSSGIAHLCQLSKVQYGYG